MSLSTQPTLQDYIDARFEAQTKPVVHYLKDEVVGNYSGIEVGHRASVFAINHPMLGQGMVSTSRVLNYDSETGRFETLNTIYEQLVISKTA